VDAGSPRGLEKENRKNDIELLSCVSSRMVCITAQVSHSIVISLWDRGKAGSR
jgi:hypothetical protein